jgi:PD-(D/E)XK nuclease superfamily protein
MPPKRARKPGPARPRTPRAKRKNTKVTGEKSEAAFLAKAAGLGLGVAKPWGDSRRHDFIFDNGECLHRVQVKCTESMRAQAYETRATYTTGKGREFIAAHVVPLDLRYIVPVVVCMPAHMLRFYPHRKARRMRLESYREAWKLILPKASNRVIDLHAHADETIYPDVPLDPVIVSESAHPQSGSAPQSKDPSELKSCTAIEWHLHDADQASSDRLLAFFHDLCRQTKPTRIPKSNAPWPVPRLKILLVRKGKRILPIAATA